MTGPAEVKELIIVDEVRDVGQSANRCWHLSMHFSVKSTRTSRLHKSLRNAVHRPYPGAISRIVSAGTKALMRGRREPYHCMRVLPQCLDHSSPASGQV